jgi:hypothetical protein
LATGSTGTRFTEGSSDDGRCYRQVRKRVFLRSHFILNMIILPRQARDKHRENTQKEWCFRQRGLRSWAVSFHRLLLLTTRMRMRPLGWTAPVWVMAVLLIVAGSTQQVRSSTATQEAPCQQTEWVWFIKDTRMFCSSCKWRMSRSFPEHFAGRTFALLAEELLPGQAEGAVFQGDLSHPSRKVRHRNVPPSLFPFCQSACWSEKII